MLLEGMTVSNGRSAPNKAGRIVSAVCNLLILVITIYGLSTFFTVGGSGNMPVFNSRCFVYFTVDSNLLAALSSLLLLIEEMRCLRSGRSCSVAVMALKHAAATAVALTFFTVVCFLSFLYPFRSLFEGVNLYMHLITPLLTVFSLCLLEADPPLRFRSVFLGLIPTIVYGAVYMILVVMIRRWADFYGFNIGGRWAISCILMIRATFLSSLGIWTLRRAVSRRKARGAAAV